MEYFKFNLKKKEYNFFKVKNQMEFFMLFNDKKYEYFKELIIYDDGESEYESNVILEKYFLIRCENTYYFSIDFSLDDWHKNIDSSILAHRFKSLYQFNSKILADQIELFLFYFYLCKYNNKKNENYDFLELCDIVSDLIKKNPYSKIGKLEKKLNKIFKEKNLKNVVKNYEKTGKKCESLSKDELFKIYQQYSKKSYICYKIIWSDGVVHYLNKCFMNHFSDFFNKLPDKKDNIIDFSKSKLDFAKRFTFERVVHLIFNAPDYGQKIKTKKIFKDIENFHKYFLINEKLYFQKYIPRFFGHIAKELQNNNDDLDDENEYIFDIVGNGMMIRKSPLPTNTFIVMNN